MDTLMQPDLSLFNKLRFLYPFRKYQNLILSYYESNKAKDRKFHIVAPPGSGKTIVGLELIRQIGKPAVIFSPTSTIQLQWRDKVSLFLAEADKPLQNEIVSTTNDRISLINTYTYQLLSTPGENLSFIEEAAYNHWKEQLFFSGISATLEEAAERIATIKSNNPAKYKTEIAKYYRTLKEQFLKDPEFDGTKLLHPNAQKLIQDLVDAGVTTIVMDESHHLLDYWALILKELLKRIQNPVLIGLTATPPLGVEEDEIENYLSILGDVDFEVPTPAVVKEGNLAPYQDLVYFTTPTEAEKQFIKNIQDTFDEYLTTLTNNERFHNWLRERFFDRPDKEGKKTDWERFFKNRPLLALSGMKYIVQHGWSIPSEIPVIEDFERPITIDDWVTLLSDYMLNELMVSNDETDHEEVKKIARILKSFGFSVTESGIRSTRSPADKILSLSDSKNDGVLAILKQEMTNMGPQLRAAVITDFETESAGIDKALAGTLAKNSGSALRTYSRIVADSTTTKLEAILVTGTKVLIDSHNTKNILEGMENWRNANGYKFTLKTKETAEPGILEILGEGKDWKSSTYVRMVTSLFEQGITRCLVGTRGLLAEGWDSLSLNTLIDLTTATTSMMVQQIRGRSLRIDPTSPYKVANNWDVVCIESHFEKGDQDLNRFIKKQHKFYGLTENGNIEKGLGHIDDQLLFTLATATFKKLTYSYINQKMLAKSTTRENIYRNWKIGEEYQNFEYSIVKLDPSTIKFKTAYTLRESLNAIAKIILGLIITTALTYFFMFYQAGGEILLNTTPGLLILAAFLLILVFIAAGFEINKYIRKAFIELPVDSFLLDIGKCVLKSLREAKFVDGSLSVDNVRVTVTKEGYYDISLDYANTNDTEKFTTALNEVLSPVTDQRYIVFRSEANIKIFLFSWLWFLIRNAYGLFFEQDKIAYHPVPTVFSTHRKYADIFARNWREYVGGGDLIYTRSERGLELLLKIRRKKNDRIRKMELKYWK